MKINLEAQILIEKQIASDKILLSLVESQFTVYCSRLLVLWFGGCKIRS